MQGRDYTLYPFCWGTTAEAVKEVLYLYKVKENHKTLVSHKTFVFRLVNCKTWSEVLLYSVLGPLSPLIR